MTAQPKAETRLTIVTNRPARALRYVLGCDAAPAWCAVVTEPAGVPALPAGSRVIGVFYEARQHRSALEWALIERRIRGGIVGLSLDEIDGLSAWRARLAGPDGRDLKVTALRAPDAAATGEGA